MLINEHNVNSLTEEAAKKLFDTIVERLEKRLRIFKEESDPEIIQEEKLPMLLAILDELDCSDAFGTEGWRHDFGIND